MKSKKRRLKRRLPVIGWREWVGIPDLDRAMKAKIDTGALTSAVHVDDLEVYYDHGCEMAAFTVAPLQRSHELAVQAQAEILDRRYVRSSSGESEKRIVVLMDLALGEHVWTSEVTLTRRDRMGFRMLLGRRALRGIFLVDPGKSFLMGRAVPECLRTET